MKANVIVLKDKSDLKKALQALQVIQGVAQALEDTKLCPVCLKFLPLSSFYPREYPRTDRGSHCKACIAKGNNKKGQK